MTFEISSNYCEMKDFAEDSGVRNGNCTLNRTVRAVENSMHRYGITRPLTIEYKHYLNGLPKTPERLQDVILRQINGSKFPKSVHETPRKLSELFIYTDLGKSLESVPIALAVEKSLKTLENEFPPPGKRKVTKSTKAKDSLQRKQSKVSKNEERIRNDIQKYSQLGEIRRKLYSMPDYVKNLDRKGVKLPENKLKSPTHQSNLNISRVKVLKTKMGRAILRKEANRKKRIEDLKQMLNQSGKKLKKI